MPRETANVYELDADTPRRLAEAGDGAAVLSIYLDLEPSEFATAQARATAVRSLLDEAGRLIEASDRPHDQRTALKRDLELVKGELELGEVPADGARAIAVFCSSRADLFDVVKLPRAVAHRVVVDDKAWVEPLVEALPVGGWGILLANRKLGRIFQGSSAGVTEVATIREETHGQHDQGGWSQRRYQTSVEQDKEHHLKRTLDALFRRFQLRRFDRLLIGAPQELRAEIEGGLHPYLRERVRGHVDLDVEIATASDVHAAAAPAMEAHERERERAAIDRLAAGVGRADGGRAAAGVGEVLEALSERRVECLLLDDAFRAVGVSCPACGWLGPEGATRCPADGSDTHRHEDVTGRAVDKALEQSADVLVVRHHGDLGALGGIGAILRF